MQTYQIFQVDSFGKKMFSGNPAGVVLNANSLNTHQMQQIARELNNSETAFVIENENQKDCEVRFFTPTTEVPLCGHATIAAHYVRAIEKSIDGEIWQKCGAGNLRIEVLKENDDFSITMTQAKPQIEPPFKDEIKAKIISALGLSKDDLRDDCPICIVGAGHSKVMIGIKNLEKLHALKPNLTKLCELSAEILCNGYYVFTLHKDEKYLVHGRMFAPAIGIHEDPVTGNANGPLGAYLVHFGLFKELWQKDKFEFNIIQGEAINRPGTMRVSVEINDEKPISTKIKGKAIIVFKTQISL